MSLILQKYIFFLFPIPDPLFPKSNIFLPFFKIEMQPLRLMNHEHEIIKEIKQIGLSYCGNLSNMK